MVMVFFSTLVFFNASAAGLKKSHGTVTAGVSKVVKEAENLSLMHDRTLACGLLVRTLKKSTPDESKILKDKINSLARVFYTERGFQSYLSAKEAFNKGRFAEASEKLTEVDEAERSNIDVLFVLALAQMGSRNFAGADQTVQRALVVNPFATEFNRLALSVEVGKESWATAQKLGDDLLASGQDKTPQTQVLVGVAKLKLQLIDDARRLFLDALKQDSNYPETHYWIAQVVELKEREKFLARYAELCKNKEALRYEKEVEICSHSEEVEKQLKH
jgi:tetratricopeptide (TPR) repeat protein